MSATAPLTQLVAEARGQMYRFLSASFLGPPEATVLRLLADSAVLDQLAALFGSAAVAELRPLADGGAAEDLLAALGQEYTDLFAVPTGRYVMPFEDVYRGSSVVGMATRGPLLGERAVAVRRMYREAGAELDRACRELPTHIGVELAFMSFLCEREAAAEGDCRATEAGRYRALQRRFLDEHLNAWAPEVCQMIRRHAATPFYRGIANLTEAFLARDAASLAPDAGEESLGYEPVGQATDGWG